MTIENTQYAENKIQKAKFTTKGKPIPLRVIFISNALIALSLLGYSIASALGLFEPIVPTEKASVAAVIYLFSFILMVKSILGKNINRLRTIIVVNFVLALVGQLYIAAVVALVSMALSFNSKVKRFFGVLN